jgi:hypothetical protein
MIDDDHPPSAEELAAAESLRSALEAGRTQAPRSDEARAAALIAHGAGREVPLGDLAARAAVRGALDQVQRARAASRRRRWAASALATAAAAAIALVAIGPEQTPRRWQSRPSDALTPGPFPPGQSAARRLDVVIADRMIALREARLYGARR